MKIALLVPGFSSDERDWCIPALLDFVRVLAARAQVHVFALRYPHRVDRYCVYGATVHSLNGVGAGGLGSPALWARAARAMLAEQRRGRFDVLHAFWAYEPGAAAWIARRFGLRAPIVTSLAGGELVRLPRIGYGLQLQPHRRLLVRLALKTSQAVTAGSRYLQDLARFMGFRAEWAPLGVDTSMFNANDGLHLTGLRDLSGVNSRALHVGSPMPAKGHIVLLEALALACREAPGLRLALAGAEAADLRRALDPHISRLGIGDRLAFLGNVPHEALPPVYRSAAFVIQSSWHEAQGLSVLEAAACGVPVLGTRVGILAELAPPDWLAPPGDAPALARLMVQATQRPQALRELGHALRAKVEQEFGLEACVERFERLYLQATDRK